MFAVSLLCAFGIRWAPLLCWPACLFYFPLWITLQLVSGRQGDARRRHSTSTKSNSETPARSIALGVTQTLTLIPAFYLIFGAVITNGNRYRHGIRGRPDAPDRAVDRADACPRWSSAGPGPDPDD